MFVIPKALRSNYRSNPSTEFTHPPSPRFADHTESSAGTIAYLLIESSVPRISVPHSATTPARQRVSSESFSYSYIEPIEFSAGAYDLNRFWPNRSPSQLSFAIPPLCTIQARGSYLFHLSSRMLRRSCFDNVTSPKLVRMEHAPSR